jgi:heptosyltransferase II
MKLLVRATNWVGDAVMSVPALEAVRRKWPAAEITILARPWVAGLYEGQPFCDRVVTMDAMDRGEAAQHFRKALREDKYDTALLLPNSFASAWQAFRAGIRERIGYACDGRSLLLTKALRPPHRGEIPAHEAYYYLELLRRAGWLENFPEVRESRLRVSQTARDLAEARLAAAGAPRGVPRIALAPGAAFGPAKCWLPERFAGVCDRLIADSGANVIIFGAASESDAAERIVGAMRRPPVNLTGQTSIAETPGLLSACDVFLGNDSGSMHVAAAVGLSVVAIFGPTDPYGTAPLTERKTILREPVFCSPCFLRRCPIDHRCMKRIEESTVLQAVRGWLNRG